MTTLEHRAAAAATPPTPTLTRAARYILAGLRLGLGWIFLWAFLDKLLGLGHETTWMAAYVNGGQPTKGFLATAATGPFADIYHDIAGATWADLLFMVGIAGVGLALITGVGLRIAAATGGLLMVLMWAAVLPPENNPFLDEHLIYAGLLALVALLNAGDTLGLGRRWARTAPVRRVPLLK